MIYCTARIDGASNPGGARDQNIYLRALRAAGAVDKIEMGRYVSRVAVAPLAVRGPDARPVITTANWPIMVQDPAEQPVPGARFMASVARREEKGSDWWYQLAAGDLTGAQLANPIGTIHRPASW